MTTPSSNMTSAIAGAAGDVSMMQSGSGGDGSAGSGSPPPVAPKDGDPTRPIVTIDGLPCGGTTSGTQRIGGRDVTIDYPCGKHEGARVTIILDLHGTLIGGASYLYVHAYFSVHKLVNSHNLIVLTPKSVSTASLGAQWGNMDNGEDVPHLLAVIDWAYTTFGKFQIEGLWLAGHSWGARFISSADHPVGEAFACNAMLAGKVKGVIGMSYLRMPSCASQLAMISTRGEMEDIPLLDQSAVAMEHGCMTPAQGPEMLGNNRYLHFLGCGPGWAHEDYEMLGKGHVDNMDAIVVKNIADTIKATEGP